jgi:hypothetical protein
MKSAAPDDQTGVRACPFREAKWTLLSERVKSSPDS